VPTEAQVRAVSRDLASRSALPGHIKAVLESMPPSTHPMTQFVAAIAALQVRSRWAAGA
jgi:citrate synthase